MTAVKKAGFAFDLMDMDIDNLSIGDLEHLLSGRLYDIYAFGCIVTGFKFVRQIASIIKKINGEAVIIAGNSVATSIPEILLRNTCVDIAVLGEGDVTIVELLRAIELRRPIHGVMGIAFRMGEEIVYTPSRVVVSDLDSIGFPDWDIFDLERYNAYGFVNVSVFSTDNVLSYPLNSARGCPFDCTFCYHVFKGQRYRYYSNEAIVDEIKRLHTRYHSNFISFWDELTFSNLKSISDKTEAINNIGFKIGWDAVTRGNLFRMKDVNLIKAMRDCGCESIAFSLENASPEILSAINKKLNISHFIEQAHALWKGGVTPLTSVIFGYPQETPDTIKYTIEICRQCAVYPSVGFLLPLPGTRIYSWAKQEGFIQDEVSYLERIGDRQDLHLNLTSMSDAEFTDIVETSLRQLARTFGLKLDSVFKTVTYQRPKNIPLNSLNEHV